MPARRILLSIVTGCLLAACGADAGAHGSTAAAMPTVAPAAGGIAYAALGASETYGTGAEPVTAGYAYLVRDAIHAASFVDAGIPGATLNDAYQTELTSALAMHATLCTVFFGVNDVRAAVSLQSFVATLHDLLVTLRRSGARLLVIGLPELAQLPAVAALHLPGLDGLTAAWNLAIATEAAADGAGFLSLSSFSSELAAHPEEVATDGLHPSTAGHARLAAAVTAALRAQQLVPS